MFRYVVLIIGIWKRKRERKWSELTEVIHVLSVIQSSI
jgi:hypothetical protein